MFLNTSPHYLKNILCIILFLFISFNAFSQIPVYPQSEIITGIQFDFSTIIEYAPGSDNWAITWADDDYQYTTWGDGGGFGGTNSIGRVSMGIGRVEGDYNNYSTININGGVNPISGNTQFPDSPGVGGKSYGIISVDGVLWLWRTGEGSDNLAFEIQDLWKSTDHGYTLSLIHISEPTRPY